MKPHASDLRGLIRRSCLRVESTPSPSEEWADWLDAIAEILVNDAESSSTIWCRASPLASNKIRHDFCRCCWLLLFLTSLHPQSNGSYRRRFRGQCRILDARNPSGDGNPGKSENWKPDVVLVRLASTRGTAAIASAGANSSKEGRPSQT